MDNNKEGATYAWVTQFKELEGEKKSFFSFEENFLQMRKTEEFSLRQKRLKKINSV